jgi:uncharacterized protein (UPF0332 family)
MKFLDPDTESAVRDFLARIPADIRVSQKCRARGNRAVTMTPFARALVRKSERALKTARIALSSEDFDNAVNRSFYSMFDIARAALLEAGVAVDKLPRTHSGLIDAFRQHAVQTGKFDRDMAADMSRIESHRIRADYTGFEIEPNVAAEAVAKAEVFVQTGHDTDREARNDQSHSIDDDLNE